MTWIEKRREKKFEKMEKKRDQITQEIIPQAKTNPSDSEAKQRVKNFASWKATARQSLPQIVLGLLLIYVEYRIIGLVFTLGSIAVYVPIILFYSKSLRERRGKYLLEISIDSGATEITRYIIPDELWDLIEFDHALVPGMIRFNGRETFLATKTWSLEGTNIIYKVKLAWLHFNQLEYARNRKVLEKAVMFATQLSMENAELEKLKEFLSVVEGKRQTKERLDLIDKAYRENPSDLKKRIEELENKIGILVKSNEELLFGPQEKEEQKEVGENAISSE